MPLGCAGAPSISPRANLGPIPDHASSLSGIPINFPSLERDCDVLHIEHRTGKVLGTFNSCRAAGTTLGIPWRIVESLAHGWYESNRYKGCTFRFAAASRPIAVVKQETEMVPSVTHDTTDPPLPADL
jgi:hypothetical protein